MQPCGLLLLTMLYVHTDARICSSIDARNDATNLKQLEGCTVVEGFVMILLMREKNFEPYSFPELREVTHYILIFEVKGLHSLGELFPNLERIGGVDQFVMASLVVLRSTLHEIGLTNLREISRGSVVIFKNEALCFDKTVEWKNITRGNPELNHVQTNCEMCEETCPSCPKKCNTGKCWNSTTCQEEWKTHNCDSTCLGDCEPGNPKKCYTCKGFRDLEGRCVSNCLKNTFQFLNRRCITKEECTSTKVPNYNNEFELFRQERENFYVLHQNLCLPECPNGMYPNADRLCVPCKGWKCVKKCTGGLINSVDAALKLRGCEFLNGSLEISIKTSSGGLNYSALEEGLGSIVNITGYLQITRSSVTNLNFLKNLTFIHGHDGNKKNLALVVTENENLQELWDWKVKNRLVIDNGRLNFHFNPKLCIAQIKKLVEVTGYKETVSRFDIDNVSNGDDFQCKPIGTNISVSEVTSHSIALHIAFSQAEVLRYVVYYIKDVHENITMFNGFTECSDDGWKTKDASVENDTKGTDIVLTDLEPDSSYVFYVSRYTMSENSGSRSQMYRRTTLPSTPSEVVGLRAVAYSEALVVSWEPPRRINGKLQEYSIKWDELREDESYINLRNYCTHPMIAEQDPAKEIFKPIVNAGVEVSSKNGNCNCTSDIHLKTQTIPEGDFDHLCGSFKNVPPGFSNRNKNVGCKPYFISNIYKKNNGFIDPTSENDPKTVQASCHTNFLDDSSSGLKSGLKKIAISQNEIVSDYHKASKSYGESSKQKRDILTKLRDKRLPSYSRNWTLSGLKPFQNYVIYIKACREVHPCEKGNPNIDEYRCSNSEMITVRTEGKKEFDAIPKNSLSIVHIQSGRAIKWLLPKNPNGLIVVAFELEYLKRNTDGYFLKIIETECITYPQYIKNGKQHRLIGLPAGNYKVRIRAVSLYGKGPESDYLSFVVEETSKPNDSKSPPITGTLEVLLYCFIVLASLVLLYIFVVCTNAHMKASKYPQLITAGPLPLEEFNKFPDQYEIDRDDVEFGSEVGSGSFGRVYEGLWKSKNLRCAIKTVNENATAWDERDFLSEALVMMSMTDANFIVEFYGVVSKSPPIVLMELMELGDLKKYLRTARESSPITNATMIKMALEIADGMAYLESQKFVHRDLAARNCMINSDHTVKIGDFGMTRDIYENDYYRNRSAGFFPIRWMAPETIRDGVFTSKSDVWSYGVVLWEIVTMAQQPYQGLSNEQVLREVKEGRRLEVPRNSPLPLKKLMTLCWKTKCSCRPSFMDIVGKLEYYHDEEFRQVAFYHSVEAAAARRAAWEYVTMNPLSEAPSTSYRLATVDEESD